MKNRQRYAFNVKLFVQTSNIIITEFEDKLDKYVQFLWNQIGSGFSFKHYKDTVSLISLACLYSSVFSISAFSCD